MKRIRVRNHRVVLNRSRGGDTFITVVLVAFGLFMFLPMLYTISQSLKPMDELFIFPPRYFAMHPTFDNFSDLFRLMGTSWVPFSRYIFNTVFISVVGTFGNLILSSLAAYVLSKMRFPGQNVLFQLIVLSLMFSSSTIASIANFLVMSWLNWIDTYWAIIVPVWCSTLGLYLMKNFMDTNIASEILESSRLDGASEFYTFLHIAMPMVKPAWLTLIVYSFQGLWNMGASPYIHSEQLKTFNYAMSQVLNGGVLRQGASAAAAVVQMIVPIIVFAASQSQIVETMGSSGMKD